MIDNNLFKSKLLYTISFVFQVWGYGTEHNVRQNYRRSLFTFWCFGHSTSRPRDSLKFLSYLSPKPKGRQEKGTKGKGKISNRQIFYGVRRYQKRSKIIFTRTNFPIFRKPVWLEFRLPKRQVVPHLWQKNELRRHG